MRLVRRGIIGVFWVLLTVFVGLNAFAGAQPDGQEITKRADKVRVLADSQSFLVRVSDFSGGKLLRATTYKVYTKGQDFSLVDTVDPPRLRGRKMLMNGNNLWLFLPEVKRPTRVSLQQRLTGEVANGDIARTNFEADYLAELAGSEVIGGKDCYKVKLTARHKDVTYRGITYWVAKENFYPVKATFFALSGKELKSAEYGGFKPLFGKTLFTQLTIRDALQPSKYSVLQYYNHKKENLDDTFFNKESVGE